MIDYNNEVIVKIEVSDENDPGESTAKKRVWHATDKQEWLSIYKEYMQKRMLKKRRPLDVDGYLCNINAERKVFRTAGKARRKLNSRKNDTTINWESYSLKRVKTVKDLQLFTERLKVIRGLRGVSERNIKDSTGNRLKKNRRNPSRQKATRNDDKDFQKGKRKEDLEKYCGTEIDLDDDLSENDLVITSNADESICLDLTNSDEEENDTKIAIDEKVKLHNIQYNSLKLLKYSNICLFKWMKHYLVCYECMQCFKDMQTLRDHVDDIHTYDQIAMKLVKEPYTFNNADITGLECRMCSVILNSMNELENHLIEHNVRLKPGGSSLIPYKLCTSVFGCQLCEKEFSNKFKLKRHMDRHFTKHVSPGRNSDLSDSGSRKQYRNKKKKKNGGALKCKDKLPSEGRFKCSHCPQRFKCDYKKLQHLIKEHNSESELFQCEFCPKIFLTLHWLTKHMNCVHRNKLYK